MPGLDIEMSNSSSSEIQAVEMEDVRTSSGHPSPDAETEKTESNHVTSNGHLIPIKQLLQPTNGRIKGEEGDRPSGAIDISGDHGIENGSKAEPTSLPIDIAQQPPLQSVEKDGTTSPATADGREMNSPAVEGKVKGVTPSPQNIRHKGPANPILPATENIKLDQEVARLKEVLNEISPQAAQKVLKEKWRTFLFDGYNEDHIAFVLRAGLKNSNATVLDRVLRDDGMFRDTLLKVASRKPAYTQKVLRNVTAAVIEEHVPENIIDQVIAERFKTVPGKTLIKWLAEAERLGYRADDILDDKDESVRPNISSRDSSPEFLAVEAPRPFEAPAPAPRYEPPAHLEVASLYKDPLLLEQEKQAALNRVHAQNVQAAIARNAALNTGHGSGPNSAAAITRQQQHARAQERSTGPLSCPSCHRGFQNFSGYTYHITKKVCDKQPPHGGYKWSCENCHSGFTTKQGMEYHKVRRVCYQPDDIAPATGPTTGIPSMQSTGKLASTYSPYDTQPRPASTSSLPPARPPMHTPQPPPPHAPQQPPHQMAHDVVTSQYFSSRSIVETPRAPVAIPKPPPPSMATPNRTKEGEPIRHSPNELSPEKRAALEQALQDAAEKHEKAIANIPAQWPEAERASRKTSLNNAYATKKSQIRKAHGVSLRMRASDREARIAAGLPGAASTKLKDFETPGTGTGTGTSSPMGRGTPGVSPPASSFSPINNPPRNNPTPPTNGYYSGPPQPPSQYKPPPPNAAKRVNNLYSPHPDTLTHAREHEAPLLHARQDPSASGFGVLRNSLPRHLTPTIYQAAANNKRRRTSEDSTPAETGNSTPALSMIELSSEDAAVKFAKSASTKKSPSEPGDAADAAPSPHGLGTGASTGEAAEGAVSRAIEILSSSSDSDGNEIPTRSDRGNGKAASRPSTGRPGFMAKRGGRR